MYLLKISKKAEKFYKALDKRSMKKIGELFTVLEEIPVPFQLYNVAKIKGRKNTFRIRIDPLRVIYYIIEEIKIIRILKIGHRENIY